MYLSCWHGMRDTRACKHTQIIATCSTLDASPLLEALVGVREDTIHSLCNFHLVGVREDTIHSLCIFDLVGIREDTIHSHLGDRAGLQCFTE